tara:strand:+ start:2378 stop:3220 length:843 start_codon:yes stop_codon:yes gene_type:complete
MKSLTIVTTWGPKYWPKPVQAGIQSTVKNWPGHAKILLYPDDMSQQLDLPRTEYYDLCKEQPKLKEFIARHKNNPKYNPRIKQNNKELKDFDKNTQIYIYDCVRFSYKVFACIDAYQRTKPDMLWFLDADIVTFEKIPMSWLEHIIPDTAFTSYLGRPKKGFSETGYYAFNTSHKYAGEFFERWQTYYDKDRFLELKGYTDSFTFDGARIELEKEGKIKNEDLNDGRWAGGRRSRHPFINSELGQYMDHLKGYDRKAAMTSKKRDLTTKQSHPYWKTLKE